MKALLAVLFAITLFSTAHAGNYSDAVAEQKFCKSAGELAQFAYQGRLDGNPKSMFQGAIPNMTPHQRNRMIFGQAVDYGYDKATSVKDAYMGAWGLCMDWQN